MQAPLPAEGWERVEQAAGSGQSPGKLLFPVPWAADGLTTRQPETVLASLGGGFRVLVRLTRGRYERRERLSFRYSKDLVT